MKPNPYESPAVVHQRIEPAPRPRWSRWILWLIPVALMMGLIASCAGGFVISERAIKREVQKTRSAGKGWDADDLDRTIVGQAERRGLIAFVLLATASVVGIPL